ncbi:MAG: HlyC/CorC family transporter [Clostridiales bacterium]|nr:HlyC/CorC family transporter [Clostridiales bacterium]
MPDGSLPLLIALIALVILSAFFSATETAYTSLNTIRLKSLSQKENKYKRVLNLYEKYDKLLTTILIGNNIVNLTASSLALIFFTLVLKDGSFLDPSVISTAVITIVVLIFGEITPKFIAKAYPEKLASFFYPLITLCYYVFYPLNFLLGLYKKLISLMFKLDREESITDEELITIVNEAEEDGTLKEDESDLIRSAIEFDDLEVKDILVPRINVISVSVDATKQEIKKIFDSERYSRIPVYKDTVDSIIGFIHEKDFYRNYFKQDFSVKDIMQKVVFVVEHTKISDLLKKLQARKVHMAVVLDEYGGTAGIVTVEDIIEELVGEIYDEYDEESDPIKKIEDNVYLINGALELDKFFEEFELLGEDEYDANTVGGFVTEILGELPVTGKEFDFKNLHIEVTKTTIKKVLEIKVIVLQGYEENED